MAQCNVCCLIFKKNGPMNHTDYEKANTSTASVDPDADAIQRRGQIQRMAADKLTALSETRMRFTVNGKEVIVREQVEMVLSLIKSVKDVVSSAISSEPHAAVAWAGVIVVLPILGGMFQQDKDALAGFELIADLLLEFLFMEKNFDFSVLESGNTESQNVMASIREKTTDLYCQIYTFQIRLVVHYSLSTMTRYGKDLAATMRQSNWSTLLDDLKKTREQIRSHFGLAQTAQADAVYNKVKEIHTMSEESRAAQRKSRRESTLGKLAYSKKALFDFYDNAKQPECLKDTQVSPLEQIRKWCEDENGKTILWLHGMAGTGKSTIARTIASALERKEWTNGSCVNANTELVGTFFFRQGDEETSASIRLLPTLAWCLVHALDALESYILDAIDNNPGIEYKMPSMQWGPLIFEPLSLLSRSVSLPMQYIVVIDSLDECEDDDQILAFLKLFEQLNDLPYARLRFLITSRPASHINSAFDSLPDNCYTRLVLRKIQPDINDIMLLFTTELAQIAEKWSLTTGWPGPQDIHQLNIRADGLFVYASTACRFLDDKSYHDCRLQILLTDEKDEECSQESSDSNSGQSFRNSRRRRSHKSPQRSLDEMYAKILRHFELKGRPRGERKDLQALFKKIVGSILPLFKPLPLASLGRLLLLSHNEDQEAGSSIKSSIRCTP